MEEKIKELKEYLITRLDNEYNLIEENLVLREILSKVEELFEQNE